MQPLVENKCAYVGIVAVGTKKITLKVLDAYGRVARTIQAQIEEGVSELKVSLGELNVGTYVVNAFSGGTFLKAIRFAKDA